MHLAIWVIVGLFAFRALSNLAYWLRVENLYKRYSDYAAGVKSNYNIEPRKQEIATLLKRANVEDSRVPTSQSMGYGQVANFSASARANMFFHSMVSSMREQFLEAIGVYRKRFFDTFNPLCWVDCIVFLPKHTLAYLGAKPDGAASKALTVVYWGLSAVAAIGWAFFREWIVAHIQFVGA
jgi:hypothetical protein